jgi:hypothetical protein
LIKILTFWATDPTMPLTKLRLHLPLRTEPAEF